MTELVPSAPTDLYITEALDARPARTADFHRQGRAILDLACRMADAPETVLPRFVDLAMQLTGAVSSGVSLYEPSAEDDVFRWFFLRGTLASFEGATTPRDFSPCGITLDRNCPQLTRHPERGYPWIVDAGLVLDEVLLVPLYLGGTEPLGTLWVVSDQPDYFTRDDARLLTELAEQVGSAVKLWRSEAAAAA